MEQERREREERERKEREEQERQEQLERIRRQEEEEIRRREEEEARRRREEREAEERARQEEEAVVSAEAEAVSTCSFFIWFVATCRSRLLSIAWWSKLKSQKVLKRLLATSTVPNTGKKLKTWNFNLLSLLTISQLL